MTALASLDLASLAASVIPAGAVDPVTGLPGRVVSYAIGRAESGGDPARLGDNGSSVGIWQQHLPAHPEYTYAQLFNNPTAQAGAMAATSSGGINWRPWTTFWSWHYSTTGAVVLDVPGRGSFLGFIAEAEDAFTLVPGATPPPGQVRQDGYYVLTNSGPLFIPYGLPDWEVELLIAQAGGLAQPAGGGGGMLAAAAVAGAAGYLLWRH